MKTIKELKEAIKDLDESLEVRLEGCDCYGDWNGKVDVSSGQVSLLRDED